MDSKKTPENQDACAGLAAATGSELPRCAYCGDTGHVLNVPNVQS